MGIADQRSPPRLPAGDRLKRPTGNNDMMVLSPSSHGYTARRWLIRPYGLEIRAGQHRNINGI